MIWQGELAKSAGSESNSCEQLLSPNYIDNRHFPNLLECTQNNSLKSRLAMKTAYLQWITLPVSISSYCFVCTQANSGSVYYVHFVMVMQFVKYSTFYLIKFNYIHCFVVYINTLDSEYLHLWTL